MRMIEAVAFISQRTSDQKDEPSKQESLITRAPGSLNLSQKSSAHDLSQAPHPVAARLMDGSDGS